LELNVSPVSTPNAINGNNSICVGATTILSSTTPNGVWSSINNRGTINTIGIYTGINVGNWGEVRYTITNAKGCSAYASKIININGIPNVPSINYAVGSSNPQNGAAGGFCSNKTFTVVGTPSGGVWSKTGVINVSSPSGVVTTGSTLGSASLTYTYTDLNGCSSSKTINGNVVSCASRGISETKMNRKLFSNNQFSVYPNPITSYINLIIDKLIPNSCFAIYDIYGKLIQKIEVKELHTKISTDKFSNGLFVIQLIENKTISSHQIVLVSN
jgi:hypothetical protein